MKNKYIQPNSSEGCSLYCLSNLLNMEVYYLLDSYPNLGKISSRKEESILNQYSSPDLKILNVLYHNSNLKHISFQDISRALKMVMGYPELKGEYTCVMPLTVHNGVLHRVYLYIQNDKIMFSDPLQESITCFHHDPTNQYVYIDFKNWLTRKKMYPFQLQIIGTIDDDEEKPSFFDSSDFEHLFNKQ